MRRRRSGHGDDRGAPLLIDGPGAAPGDAVELILAPWGRRALGALVDWVAPWLVAFACRWWASSVVVVVGGQLAALVWTLWMAAMTGASGQSLGKRLALVTVLGEDSAEPIGARRGLLRWLAHLVDFAACFVGWLLPLGDPKRQTLADKIMGTIAVDLSERRPPPGC